MSPAVLEGRDLSREFVIGGRRFAALYPTSITLSPGQFIAITGPSGSGKSTLMNLLSGLDVPSTGEVRYRGESLHRLSIARLAALRNADFGFVFQSPHVIPAMTVQENVMLPLHYGAQPPADAESRVQHLLDYVGLTDFADRYPNTLSGGEQQRLVFARALVRNPAVIFADEPTGNLDAENSHRLLSLLAEQTEKGRSVLMVTHDRQALDYGADEFMMDKFQQ